MGRRYNPYMFEDYTQPVVVPRRGMSRRTKLLAGLAAAGAIGGTLYGTRNMKYGASTLGKKAWNSDRVQSGINRAADSDIAGAVLQKMTKARQGFGVGPINPMKGSTHRTAAKAISGVMGSRPVRAVENAIRDRRYYR